MRHWFNWLLGEPLPKYTPPMQYKVESSSSGLPCTYLKLYSYPSLEKVKEKMYELILDDPYRYYRIVRY